MKRIIITIERSKFNYLYKYNTCTVSTGNVINFSLLELLELSKSNLKLAASFIEKALPLFESEHEVILLEVESSEIRYNLEFEFNAVKRIVPLNELAKELLQSKLNPDFQYASPIPVDLYEEIFSLREDKLRSNSAGSVLACFKLPTPKTSFTHLVRDATRRLILNKKITKDAGTIDFLLEFNTTPSGIPSGNIEGLMKIICVGLLKVTGNTDRLRQSPLFNLLLDNLVSLNQGSLLNCYQKFLKIAYDNKDKVEKLKAILASPKIDTDLFVLLFLFTSFKKEIQGNDFDLKSISSDIDEIRQKYSRELSQALYLIGYTMSMTDLHESIHRLSFSSLFGVQTEREELNNNEEFINDTNTPETKILSESTDASADHQLQGSSDSITRTRSIDNDYGNRAFSVQHDELPIIHNASEKLNAGLSEPNSDGLLDPLKERDSLLKEAIKKLKKLKGTVNKQLLELIETLHKESRLFTYSSLEKQILSNEEFLKKDKNPKKAVQELLGIFKSLK